MSKTTKSYCDLYSDSEIERNDAKMYRPKPTAKEMLVGKENDEDILKTCRDICMRCIDRQNEMSTGLIGIAQMVTIVLEWQRADYGNSEYLTVFSELSRKYSEELRMISDDLSEVMAALRKIEKRIQ